MFLTGIGPGNHDMMTAMARWAVKNCQVVCGYDRYVDHVREIIPYGTKIFTSGMRGEVERAEAALAFAADGNDVCLVCGGDPSLYSLASLVYQLDRNNTDIEIIPGVTAAMAASARLGAPVADDMAIISMSDLLTPWEVIKKRIEAVNLGDFVAAIYNPKSMKRTEQIVYTLESFREARGDLITGTVKSAFRDDEEVRIAPISEFDYEFVNMTSIVMVGCTKTIMLNGRMVTPRGYPV